MKDKPNVASCRLTNRKISVGKLPDGDTGIEFKIVDGKHNARTISLPLRNVGTITRLILSPEATITLYNVLDTYIKQIM